MGLNEWINNCRSIIPEEEMDWIKMTNRLNATSKVVLMPSITCDAWPIHVLNDLKYGERIMGVSPSIYVVPLGTNDFWIKQEVEQLVEAFYQDEEISDRESFYELSLEEIILLNCCDSKNYLCINKFRANGFVAEIKTKEGDSIYVFAIMEKPEEFWEEIVQKFEIPIICIVDSNKGLGDWFTEVPLYKSMIGSNCRTVLPPYYFKGKYISANAPDSFEWIADIKESPAHTCVTQLYKTGW